MMKSNVSRMCALAFLFAAVLTAVGCSHTSSEPAAVQGITDKRLAAEIALGEKMLQAYTKNDAKAFVSYLRGDAAKNFGEKEFKTTRDQIVEAMGTIMKAEYLDVLHAPGFRSHMWKVTFERRGARDGNRILRQETLFRVVVMSTEEGKDLYLLSFGFL